MKSWFLRPGLLTASWLAAAGMAAPAMADGRAPAAALTQAVAANAGPAAPKLDSGLEAIERAWRRFGIRGAERESASRNIPLDNLRLAAVIQVASADRRPEVERALRKAWGEVVTTNGTAIYAQLPVPAIRRISRMSAVAAVSLDQPLVAATGPSKEPSR